MSTPSARKKAPSVLLCVVIFLCVCAAVGAANSAGGSGEAVMLHKSTATALTCTPLPTATPSAVPTATPSAVPTAAELPAPPETVALPVVTSALEAPQEEPVNGTWVLNTSTKRFHEPDCKSVPTIKEKNRGEFTGEREELIRQGYKPCGNCKP